MSHRETGIRTRTQPLSATVVWLAQHSPNPCGAHFRVESAGCARIPRLCRIDPAAAFEERVNGSGIEQRRRGGENDRGSGPHPRCLVASRKKFETIIPCGWNSSVRCRAATRGCSDSSSRLCSIAVAPLSAGADEASGETSRDRKQKTAVLCRDTSKCRTQA